ncbi:glutamate--cysteine ligase [Streptomyces sp. NPDC045369]|uniref:glutamate--cysteine ligase n=1 Tax=Streptomyces sp. NPDC045369 TaxID=3155732 RepID=UPI0033C1D010
MEATTIEATEGGAGMGRHVGDVTFAAEDFTHFRSRLRQCLETLPRVMGHGDFGVLPAMVGAELELSLVDASGRPVPVSTAVRAALDDDRIALEVARSNVEVNLTPVNLAGRPFTAPTGEAESMPAHITAVSLPQYGARAVPIGTLPTLRAADLTAGALTPQPRFHALEEAWARRRTAPFLVRVRDGTQGFVAAESVAVQGAACSWQVHLTVPPHRFCRTFNAAQVASGPALAAAGNSPLPFGGRAWQEARIPLYEHGFGDWQGTARQWARLPRVGFGHAWLRGGPLTAFEDAVRNYDVLLPAPRSADSRPGEPYPALEELRLHLSTLWPWNRPVYDPAGNLRIEFRALPSGPTPLDMAANTAFLIGLTYWLAAEERDVAQCLPFAHARANFYRAARNGLDCALWWPPCPGEATTCEHQAASLVRRLLPQARAGLRLAGVAADEADGFLHLLECRVASGRTGAWWQQRAHESLGDRTGQAAGPRELGELTERYARLAEHRAPVHTWNLPSDVRRRP